MRLTVAMCPRDGTEVSIPPAGWHEAPGLESAVTPRFDDLDRPIHAGHIHCPKCGYPIFVVKPASSAYGILANTTPRHLMHPTLPSSSWAIARADNSKRHCASGDGCMRPATHGRYGQFCEHHARELERLCTDFETEEAKAHAEMMAGHDRFRVLAPARARRRIIVYR